MEQLDFFMQIDTTNSNKTTTKADNTEYCLWNGEYGYHDLSHINGLAWIKKNQQNIYPQYIGIEIGDFTCLEVEYDWGKRDQRWKVKCNLCGEETYKYHVHDWKRGKGGKTICHCRKDAEKEAIEERKIQRHQKINEEVGKEYGKYEVIEYKGFNACKVRCKECGSIRRTGVTIEKLKNGIYPKCDCDKPRYGDKTWIGKRVGHLVTVGHEGHYFICKCDCGRERVVLDSYFAQSRYRDCGDKECEYIAERRSMAIKAKERGETYEWIAQALLETSGYNVKHVGKTGDYGIDLIATNKDGMKIGVQCKSNLSQTIGVNAVMEAYAGGRYYDLEHFAVIGHGGYSIQATNMAKKLGVYLSDGQSFDYPDEMETYVNKLVPTYNATKNLKAQKLYEINGIKKTLANWAFEFGVSEQNVRNGLKRGLSIENALHYMPHEKPQYTVMGITGTIDELCDHFKVVGVQCVKYRMKEGMSIEKAMLTPKQTPGRPKKEQKISESGKRNKAEYYKEWRKRHPGKTTEYQTRYWNNKAKEVNT